MTAIILDFWGHVCYNRKLILSMGVGAIVSKSVMCAHVFKPRLDLGAMRATELNLCWDHILVNAFT